MLLIYLVFRARLELPNVNGQRTATRPNHHMGWHSCRDTLIETCQEYAKKNFNAFPTPWRPRRSMGGRHGQLNASNDKEFPVSFAAAGLHRR